MSDPTLVYVQEVEVRVLQSMSRPLASWHSHPVNKKFGDTSPIVYNEMIHECEKWVSHLKRHPMTQYKNSPGLLFRGQFPFVAVQHFGNPDLWRRDI